MTKKTLEEVISEHKIVGLEYDLSKSIRNYEGYLKDTKALLEEVSRDKITFPPTSEHTIWFRQHLREFKNEVESTLKELILEKTYENQGMNPPYCYKKF